MIITSSAMAMGSRQEMFVRYTRNESLTMWRNSSPPPGQTPPESPASAGTDKVSLSPQAKKAASAPHSVNKETAILDPDELKFQLVRRMLEMLTGRKINVMSPKEFLKAQEEASQDAQATADALTQAHAQADQPAGNPPPPEGWGMIYQSQETRHEQETMVFAAQGKVTTADGKEIDISVELGMSREFMEQKNIEIRAGDAARLTDPLVINFGGTAAQLTDTKFKFDLDSNGTPDQISFATGGSGFLAMDKNNDGTINDGSELFGPSSGNGFSELAKHDQDGNQWIDENDSVFSKLRIWNKTDDSKDQLSELGQKGIGAIYLGKVGSEFSIKDSTNQLQGQVRSTGLFLREDGSAGTVQQVDLTA